MAVLLLVSLCVATVIQLTSSQSTYDVIQQENDVNNCGRTEQMNHELATAVSQLLREVAELKAQRDVAKLATAMSQLQTDVAKLIVFVQQKDEKGRLCLKPDGNQRGLKIKWLQNLSAKITKLISGQLQKLGPTSMRK